MFLCALSLLFVWFWYPFLLLDFVCLFLFSDFFFFERETENEHDKRVGRKERRRKNMTKIYCVGKNFTLAQANEGEMSLCPGHVS